jgi:hypothetical protein
MKFDREAIRNITMNESFRTLKDSSNNNTRISFSAEENFRTACGLGHTLPRNMYQYTAEYKDPLIPLGGPYKCPSLSVFRQYLSILLSVPENGLRDAGSSL